MGEFLQRHRLRGANNRMEMTIYTDAGSITPTAEGVCIGMSKLILTVLSTLNNKNKDYYIHSLRSGRFRMIC